VSFVKISGPSPRLIDLSGQRFGRLVAKFVLPSPTNKRVCWHCACDCGKTHLVAAKHLRSGRIRSCGCLNNECRANRVRTHGCSDTSLYEIWQTMIKRCHNPKAKKFPDYGGRGISVCDRWRRSFADFAADVGDRPEGSSLDRKDNNGNYEPGNVRWATATEQSNNKRNTILITHDGITMSLKQWSVKIGIRYSTLYARHRKGLALRTIAERP
jgi:hypothetical protein